MAGLEQTIMSVITQSSKDFQWIIIDGGSTDGSKELLEQYHKYFTYWCSEPDREIYNAMNKGIKHATGDYCSFLNSGDRLHDKNVIKEVMEEMDGTDYVSGNVWCVNDSYEFVKFYKMPQVLSLYYMLELTLGHQRTFIRTKMLKARYLSVTARHLLSTSLTKAIVGTNITQVTVRHLLMCRTLQSAICMLQAR